MSDHLRTQVITAVRWTATARLIGQILSWVITIIVIRILSPADYGLMAEAAVIVAFFTILNSIGFDAVLVQRADLDERLRRATFGLVIVVNVAFFLVLFFGAPLIAAFFDQPRLAAIMQVMSFQFLMLIFETLPQSRLEREIRFKRRSIVDLATLFAGSIVTLVLAYLQFGVWALVWGNMVTIATRMIGLNIIERSFCVPLFSLTPLRESFSYGGYVTIDRVLRFAFGETDKFIGGKIMGAQALGYYAVASHIASLPIQKLTGFINSIAFPAFAQTERDSGDTARYLLKAGSLMSLFAFPVFFGISSVAYELTLLLLGKKWLIAALPLQIISIAMPLRMLYNIFQPFLWGVGRPGVSASNFAIAAIAMPAAFVVGAQWGPVGLSVAWVAVYPMVFVLSVARASSLVGVRPTAFFASMAGPLLAATLMYLAVLAVSHVASGTVGSMLHLSQLVLTGVVVYVAAAMLCCRQTLFDAIALIRH